MRATDDLDGLFDHRPVQCSKCGTERQLTPDGGSACPRCEEWLIVWLECPAEVELNLIQSADMIAESLATCSTAGELVGAINNLKLGKLQAHLERDELCVVRREPTEALSLRFVSGRLVARSEDGDEWSEPRAIAEAIVWLEDKERRDRRERYPRRAR